MFEMFDFLKGLSSRKGLPPGTVAYTGEKISKKVRIRIMDFDENNFVEKDAQEVEDCFPFKNTPSNTNEKAKAQTLINKCFSVRLMRRIFPTGPDTQKICIVRL